MRVIQWIRREKKYTRATRFGLRQLVGAQGKSVMLGRQQEASQPGPLCWGNHHPGLGAGLQQGGARPVLQGNMQGK